MDLIHETHVSEPGLLVGDVAAADDATALAFQQLLPSGGRRPQRSRRRGTPVSPAYG